MAGRYTRGYRAHRGRRRGSLALKVVIGILLALLAAGILFLVFLGRYIEYTDHGVQVNLPWMQQQEEQVPAVSDPVVIVTDDPTQAPTRQQAEGPDLLGAVQVTPEQLVQGTAAQAVAQAGGNALVVEMKDVNGRLAWLSQSEQASALGVNAQDNGVAEAITALAEEGEVWLVAAISCFRDQALASAGIGGPLMTRGGNVWYDPAGYRWVSPVSSQGVEYLAQLCQELADMGFDEILLEYPGFPGKGETGVLATSDNRPEDLETPVAGLFEQLHQALEGTGTTLSALVGADTALGEEQLTGVTPELLAQYAHRVWVTLPEAGEQALAQALAQAGMEQAQQRIVSLGGNRAQGSWTTLADPS